MFVSARNCLHRVLSSPFACAKTGCFAQVEFSASKLSGQHRVITFLYRVGRPSGVAPPMASSEVNMHMEEVVVVTTPDSMGLGNPEEKAVLVTSDLEQADCRSKLSEETPQSQMGAETESEVEAEGTSIAIPKDTVIVKLSEEVSVEADVHYPITCGESHATLIWKKFVCPGINIKCVQYNEHLISPKEFVYLAGKSTLKDWKRAIRLNGTMLRRMMDTGELDFYQHSKLCSNTCRSTKIDLVGTRAALQSQTSTEQMPHTPNIEVVNGSPNPLSSDGSEDRTEWVTAIGEDTMTFWRNLNEAGLLEEVMSELQNKMEETLTGMEKSLEEPPLQVDDAVLLNKIVQSFGMLDLVKKVLAGHKSQMDRCREQYTRSLVALEQQCDEHRKRARELKSRSQTLSSVLMTLAPAAPPTPSKRPRLTRAVSGPASITTAHQSSATALLQPATTLPFTQLTGLPLGRVLSGTSPLLGGYTLVTSTGEVLTDGVGISQGAGLTLLTSEPTSTPPAGATILKLLSPVQILTLPQLSTTSTMAANPTHPLVETVLSGMAETLAPGVEMPSSSLEIGVAHVDTTGSQLEETSAEGQVKAPSGHQ